jgi:hypothetical protein
MYFYLLDRGDRLGQNLIIYLAQIFYAHNNKYFIKFYKKKELYRFYDSIFVKTLLNYIERYNAELDNTLANSKYDDILFFTNIIDHATTTTDVLRDIKLDFISYCYSYIYDNIKHDFEKLGSSYNIPFDVNNTILVHLRLDDVARRPDYDGSICSNYYKNKIKNNEHCVCEFYHMVNNQAPFSKPKMDSIINKAKNEFPGYKVILITSPGSDTSYLNYDYEVISSNDESLDLFFLTMCKVVILSRSTFSLASVFFNENKIKSYVPLWGHFVCCGLDTIHDKTDSSKIEYFV